METSVEIEYYDFLKQKQKAHILSGFDVELDALHPDLFPFQKFCVQRALKAGKYALFEDCGLGKTFQQLEWSKQVSKKTGNPVLILAPLAVVGQTIKEGGHFGYDVKDALGQDDLPFYADIQIANYEQLDNIDISIYSGVVLDECFAADTKIKVLRNNIWQDVYIKDCKIGDKILNCTGIDTIKKVKSKKIPYAIRIKYNGRYVISSPRHPYFTQRGWIAAKNLRREDVIIATSKAVRILQKRVSSLQNRTAKNQVLRDILFSEMAHDATAIQSESSQFRNSNQKRKSKVCLVQNRIRKNRIRTHKKSESYVESGNSCESFRHIEENRTQTFSTWGQWSGTDLATAINAGCTVRQLDSGIFHIFGETSSKLPNELQSRLSELRSENCDRTGWINPLQPKEIRREKRQNAEFFRLESFEVLEQGCPELDKYRNESGELYFFDLEIERHPSFTINGGLVHNSSILKNFEGATRNLLIDKFKNTPYKLCCTATPSPNDPMELGNHAEFLDVMSRNEMLAMYFVHDGGETSKWRLKGHATKLFYQWVSTWAIMLNKPQDIGFKMDGYHLPELNLIERQIKTETRNNGSLFNSVAVSATNFNAELRLTKLERMDQVAEIVNNSNESFIIWVKQNEEGDLLRSLIPDAVEVKGNDKPEYKKEKLLGFANNDFRVLITKTKIGAMGLNYQNCHNQIFASLDFSFESLYQGIRRSYRFGQEHPVNIWLITTDTMQNVIESINRKQSQFINMQNEMAAAINENLNNNLQLGKNYDTEAIETEQYRIKRGDCVQLIKEVPSESVGLSVFSPPFAELYTYSAHLEDMGNSKDYKEFLTQFGFLVNELYRVMQQGRNVAVHCMDLPIQKGKEGFIGLRDFSGMILRAFEDAGFVYHSRITIWKDPVTEMQRTKALGLLHKQVKKDSTMSRVGIPDYVLVFRKDGERKNPVKNTDISVDLWQKYASPVWYDINYSNTLQGWRNGREEEDEKHICPLQLDTIERLIHLYSNKGDTVLTPFMGIGSEAFQAVKMGRKAIGFELKESYFAQSKQNLAMAVELKNQLLAF